MVRIGKIWDETSLEVREAWHRVTCLNSRDPKDLGLTILS